MVLKRDPNLNDVDLILCPFCNKAMVWARPRHHCNALLKSEEYTNEKLGVRLLWTIDNRWRSYSLNGGDVIEDLSFADVFNWVNNDPNMIAMEDT